VELVIVLGHPGERDRNLRQRPIRFFAGPRPDDGAVGHAANRFLDRDRRPIDELAFFRGQLDADGFGAIRE
jgi:hypothetical protein